MATRRDGREWAVQILFQLDLNPDDVEKALAHFWSSQPCDPRTRRFTEMRVHGVLAAREQLDKLLVRYAEHWGLQRMQPTDRNVMRLALYEMLFCPDVPPVVSINEAVDIAKYFGSSESGRFVNGILDRARKDLSRPARTAGEATGEAAGDAPGEGET